MAEIDLEQLSPSQREALEQYTQVTDQDIKNAVPLLQRSEWNVQIAIAKFFDGEGPDLVAEAMAAQTHSAPLIAPQIENFQGSLAGGSYASARGRRGEPRSDPAPRIVPRQPTTHRPPWFVSLLMSPFTLGLRLATSLLNAVVYILAFLPASIRPRAIRGAATTPGLRSATGRRMQMPRDTAERFKREFEEMYGSNELPWFEGGIAQAHDLTKKDLKFLLVVLLSPEHDDTESFARETLLSPEVLALVKNPANNVILWGGNVLDSEGYQVSQEYNCTKFPFSAVVCLTPKEGSSRMGIVKRLVGPMPAASYVADITAVMDRFQPDLEDIRSQRAAQEVARNLRSEQDSAYERSLALDRERARQRREEAAAAAEAERKANEEAENARLLEEKRQQWRRWRAALAPSEPAASEPGVVRLALKLPEDVASTRVVRRFAGDASIEELYAFVECFDILSQGNAADDAETTEEKVPERPQDYKHYFRFRIASVMPRVLYPPSESATIGATFGRSGNLIVETLFEDEEDE